MKLRNKLAALAVGVMAMVGGLAVASPAMASVSPVCSDSSLCLFQWKNLEGPNDPNGVNGSGRWQSSIYNIYTHTNMCLNLGSAAWPNGDLVTDNSASMQFIGTTAGYGDYYIVLYNWTNCNISGPHWARSADAYELSSDLSVNHYDNPDSSYVLYHTITSIGMIHK